MASGSLSLMKNRYHTKRIILKIVLYLLITALGLVFLSPFLWLVSTSLKPMPQVFRFPPEWIPHPFMWSNYYKALTMIPFFTYFKNSAFIAVTTVFGSLLSCSLVGYSFARIKWPGRDFFFVVLLSTLMIPFPVTMIPLFIVFQNLRWLNTFMPLIIPAFFGSAFLIFLLRQFFMTIPMDLSDAARIDGCSEFGIYFRIILPLSKPALAVVAIFEFLYAWNDFLGPLIYLNKQTKYTLAIGLQQFRGAHAVEWPLLMAATTVVILPVIVLFFFTQRYFIEGVTLTGMKG
jgi:ABC-type glycerol-3-phosphate transport system permease component